jgi:two-component system, OmpR family, sensor histidine kinase SenX3
MLGPTVEITISDQGLGIPEAELDRIFERFYRLDPARSRDTGGTGLGLSIVKHVAASHGGDIVVWSEPGQGSSFTLRIPSIEASQLDPYVAGSPTDTQRMLDPHVAVGQASSDGSTPALASSSDVPEEAQS